MVPSAERANARPPDRALLVGASRGIGFGLAQEYLQRGWRVVATVRSPSGELSRLARAADGRLVIEQVDINVAESVIALREKLARERFHLLFLVAGISGRVEAAIHTVPPAEAAHVFLTNAYSPVVFADAFADLVEPDGVIAFMTSRLASSQQTKGQWEIYRASKAAQNALVRSFHDRRAAERRCILSLAPGWVKTDLGGWDAPFDAATSARNLADVIAVRRGQPGYWLLDYDGSALPP
jgi:NAD(P)-dependent dehydrogenase (short-subunit alcohol dehydrogenase family)